jgi:hypothetical protein
MSVGYRCVTFREDRGCKAKCTAITARAEGSRVEQSDIVPTVLRFAPLVTTLPTGTGSCQRRTRCRSRPPTANKIRIQLDVLTYPAPAPGHLRFKQGRPAAGANRQSLDRSSFQPQRQAIAACRAPNVAGSATVFCRPTIACLPPPAAKKMFATVCCVGIYWPDIGRGIYSPLRRHDAPADS